ncbi:hypothetical protein V5O48_013230 [Marasmius crinis-equi]|uniref:Uncharacterized protein n=1 Tax=Marasmius crinis-equi TaxID=585013 RepID=A0ABR3F0N4_9AGAR
MPSNYTTLLAPVVQNANNAALGSVVFTLLLTRPNLDLEVWATKNSHEDWLEKARQILMSNPSLLASVYTWLTESMRLSQDEVAGVGPCQVVDLIISVMALIKGNQTELAYLYLARMQTYIVNGWSTEQHRITDLEHDVGEDNDDAGTEGDGEGDKGDNEDKDYEDNAMDVDEDSDEDSNDEDDDQIEADEVNVLPASQECMEYLQTCRCWRSVLDRVINLLIKPLTDLVVVDSIEDPDPPDFVELKKAVVACLQEAKKVPKHQYSRKAFIDAVRDLGRVENLLDEELKRGTESLKKGKELFKALWKNPALIPTAANPSSLPKKDPKTLYQTLLDYLKEVIRKAPNETVGKGLLKLYTTLKIAWQRKDSSAPSCWRTFLVKRNTNENFLESMRGKGVTFAPPGEQMHPTKSRDPSKPVTEIVSANSFDTPLRKISPREDVIKRCQREAIIIEDEDTPGIMVSILHIFSCFSSTLIP